MSNYKKGDIPLTNILHPGSTNITGTNNATFSGVTALTTTYANSKPLNTGYQLNGTDISNKYAAKHIIITSTQTITKPTGATSLRYMIIGGSGGGGGGAGGGYHNDSSAQDHALLGYEGRDGFQGEVKTGTVPVTSYSTITIEIGAGGVRGTGGAATGLGQTNGGTNGNAGGSSTLKGDTTLLAQCLGGEGGQGGIVILHGNGRRTENDRGHGSSWTGWNTSTATNKVTNAIAGNTNGNTKYGLSDEMTEAEMNTNQTPTTPVHSYIYKTDWEDGLTGISSTTTFAGTGGDGGWGYGDGKGSNSGKNGNNGSSGKACIIWLYG